MENNEKRPVVETKRPYETPRVECLGKLGTIIRGAGSFSPDGFPAESGAIK